MIHVVSPLRRSIDAVSDVRWIIGNFRHHLLLGHGKCVLPFSHHLHAFCCADQIRRIRGVPELFRDHVRCSMLGSLFNEIIKFDTSGSKIQTHYHIQSDWQSLSQRPLIRIELSWRAIHCKLVAQLIAQSRTVSRLIIGDCNSSIIRNTCEWQMLIESVMLTR